MKKPFGKPVMDEEEPVDPPPMEEEANPMEEDDSLPAEGEEPPMDAAADMGDGTAPTPEEQEMKDKFVAQALNMIYKKDGMYNKVLEMLEGGGDPVKGLATATSTIVARIYESASSSGIEMPADVVWAAGTEIFEDLAELSRRAKIKDYREDQDAFEGAFLQAADEARTLLQGSGKIDKEAAAADMAKLKEMDDKGELEQKFMDLAAKDDEGGGEPFEDGPPMRGGMGKMAGVA